ncbi:hypothetical protein C8245_11410 [Paracidovorax avenae]|uniref:DUF4265 domain-containing protein n=1 Tax=Paracidovorax avenae TaxID=80867 RepID=UPI000D20F172|nr:DUF4265 domain-containing protein [Paracidovorax avenae]AVS66199.1 hypothetical protein C8245_11410 [Paracidovorax avenae]
MEDRTEIIRVFAGKNQHGNVYEELPAKKISDNIYVLLASPGLLLGLAKGDLIHLHENHYEILEHGGNFCIQMYVPSLDSETIKQINNLLKPISGTLDGHGDGALAFSVPVSSGFSATNKVFDNMRTLLGSEYYYSNIYKDSANLENEDLKEWASDQLNKE